LILIAATVIHLDEICAEETSNSDRYLLVCRRRMPSMNF